VQTLWQYPKWNGNNANKALLARNENAHQLFLKNKTKKKNNMFTP